MDKESRYLVDVGMGGLPFPIRVISRADPDGQQTVAEISVNARIMSEFEATWIDTIIRIIHHHRDRISAATLRKNIGEYYRVLKANAITVTFTYPLFVEKETPRSKEKCLVKYDCAFVAKTSSVSDTVTVLMKISIPCITTYPASDAAVPGGLLGQLSVVDIEAEATEDVYPEDLLAIVDKHALSPVYSYLTAEDQKEIIGRLHSTRRTSVVMVDEIKKDLARDRKLSFYSVRCRNYGMLHSYNTVLATEKSAWVPFSGVDYDP